MSSNEPIRRERNLHRRLALASLAVATVSLGHGALAAEPDLLADYFAHWFERVDRVQDSQPHWATPLATTTPRITEQFRYDEAYEQLPGGAHLQIHENGKGLDLIPWDDVGVMLGVPPHDVRTNVKPAQGWGDWPFFRIKYRIANANEANGNYIVTAYVQATAPTGVSAFTNRAYALNPTLAFGKGWGDFDIQTTIGQNLPLGNVSTIGHSLAWNMALQYRLWRIWWPELEINDTYWEDGPRGGKNQLLMTAGLVVSRIPLAGRTSLTVGAGYQFAVSPAPSPAPAPVPTLNRALLITTHLTF